MWIWNYFFLLDPCKNETGLGGSNKFSEEFNQTFCIDFKKRHSTGELSLLPKIMADILGAMQDIKRRDAI